MTQSRNRSEKRLEALTSLGQKEFKKLENQFLLFYGI